MTAQDDQLTPLRVGVIIDSFEQPRWVRKSIEKILAAGVAKVELIFKVKPRKSDPGSLLYRLYNRIDRSLFASDAVELVGIQDLLDSVAMSEAVEEIRATDLDVFINFGPTEMNPKFAGAAKHGVWFYSFGDAPGLKEVINQNPITVSSLRSLKGDTEHIIYQSVSPTLSRFSIRLNNNTCYWKSAAFVARGLVSLSQSRSVDAICINHCPDKSPKLPGNVAMSQMFLKLAGRGASRAFEKLSSFEQWILAYRIQEHEFKYLIPPLDRYWADPFPLKVDGRYYIFFEDFLKSADKAHISVIEVDQNGILSGPTEVLKLDCHLSYPFVFDWRGDYYMIPETGDRNVVELYRSVAFPFKWERQKVLLEANAPLDATLTEVNGTWWMFVSIQEEGVAVNWDELHLYYSESLFGPWKPHPCNPIVSDVRSARPAGRLFWSNNVLYRPSQDSSLRYGYATTINEITKLSPSAYNETEVLKILPNWDKDIIGVHTLNLVDEVTVIDCLAKRRPFRSVLPRSPCDSIDLLSSANIHVQR